MVTPSEEKILNSGGKKLTSESGEPGGNVEIEKD